MASLTVASRLQALFPVAVILFLAIAGVNAQICQTSGGSPEATDATSCMNALIAVGNTQCCQTNCGGPDDCTNICKFGTAASDLCGNCGNCVPCQEAAFHLATIIQNCKSSAGLVGGYIYGFSSPTLNVNAYHT